VARWADSC